MEIQPIRSDADLEAVLAEIDRLMDAGPGTPEGDRLDLQATLAEAYEARATPMPRLDPVATILAHLENRGLSRRDLEPAIGCRERVAEVAGRKRALTLPMIRRLHGQLGIPLAPSVREQEEVAAA
jgi:HTH-type transcriptional regulator / antitoxin HigA